MRKLFVLLAMCVLTGTACFAQQKETLSMKIERALGLANKQAAAQAQKTPLPANLKEYNPNGKLVFSVLVEVDDVQVISDIEPVAIKRKNGTEYYPDRPDYKKVQNYFITHKTLVCHGIFTKTDGSALLDKECSKAIKNLIKTRGAVVNIKFDLKNLGSYSEQATHTFAGAPFFYQSDEISPKQFTDFFGYTKFWIPLNPKGEASAALKKAGVPNLTPADITAIFANLPAAKSYETGNTHFVDSE